MKLSFVLMVTTILQASAAGYAQKITLSQKDATLEQIFWSISSQSKYEFVYDAAMLREAKPVDVKFKNSTVESVLNRCFTDQPLTYTINDNIVIVKRKTLLFQSPKLPELTPVIEVAPPIIIKGQVSDSKGESLPGVSVRVKGSPMGTATDLQGNYTLSVNDNDILVFSYVGYIAQDVAVNGRSTLNVTLQIDLQVLGEIVVTALGIEREAKSLTYAVQNIKGDKLNEAKETNLINSLQGKVAGVTITKDATGPGGDSKVLIRGNRSITNSNQPLYVIDGVPLSGNVGMLNSDEVESMTILKGASAAALYGSQGQNGAIIITTKRGKANQTVVNFISGLGLDQAAVLPELQYEYGQGDAGIYGANSERSWGPKATGQMVTLWNGKSVPLTGQPDNIKSFFRTAQTFNNTLSVSGGGEKMRTYFSYGNTMAQGILTNNDLTRHNVDLKTDNNITSKLSVSTKMSYIFEDVDNRVVPGGSGNYVLPSIFSSPTSIPLDEMKNYSYLDNTLTEKQSYWAPGSSVLLNPYWALNRINYYQKRDRILGLVSAKYEFTKSLNFQIRGSIDKTIQNNNRKVYADSYFSQVGSNYDYGVNRNQGINVDALLSFQRDLGKKFDITGNIGGSLQESKYESISGSANGLNKPNFFYMSNAKSPFFTTIDGRAPRVQSLYGTATLAYNKYLYLDITARNDWSSALPKESQSYFYPSVGLSAIISDMVELPSWITYGKASLTMANSGYGGTQYLDRNYYSVGIGGAIITPNIQSLGTYKPELTTSYEAGLDWRFFNNRFGINATYYNTQTKNQLLLIGLPSASLFDRKYINAGLIQNHGIELVANFTPVTGKDFRWDAAVNYSKNINKVKQLTETIKSIVIGEGDNVYLIKVDEGSSYGDMYVRGWKEDAQGRKLVENDGTPILTDGLDQFVGNYNPDYMLGFSNEFSFKNVSMSFLIDHRQGGTIIGGTQAIIDAYGHSKASLLGREGGIVLDGYRPDGQKNTQAVSSQKYFGLIGGRYPSAGFYSYSSTNTRLREFTLGYQFSDKLLGKTAFIKSAKLSLVGRNLFFFKKDAPIDPEVTRGINGGGLEYTALPSTRNFGLNLKVSF
ncbi:MAG: SusC/RagA family TonB-linked outer membrane protein [Daejeonella sp.]|nr:SusC/RagA family TonB-linked outer membrane protein [Daejeonella sp.]